MAEIWACAPCLITICHDTRTSVLIDDEWTPIGHGQVASHIEAGLQFRGTSGQVFYPRGLTIVDGIILCAQHASEKLTTDSRYPGAGYLLPRRR